MCWRAGRGLAGKAPFWLSPPVRSLEQWGRYMVSQAFRKLKVLWARAFNLQTRGRARDGRDTPQATGCVTGVWFPVLSATMLPFH